MQPNLDVYACVFCHNSPWIMIAETVIGRGDRAFEYYTKIASAYVEEISEIHRTEPYCYSQMVVRRDAVRHGEAKNSWLTGTASWNYMAATQYILGVRAEHGGLVVGPFIPVDWQGFKIPRIYRGETFDLEVRNPNGVMKGVRRVGLNGMEIPNQLLPPSGDGRSHKVLVKMGRAVL